MWELQVHIWLYTPRNDNSSEEMLVFESESCVTIQSTFRETRDICENIVGVT